MSKRKPYQREVSSKWWLAQAFYSKYMLREGSSIFITLYSLILGWGVFSLSQGEAAFNAWMESLQHPSAIIFHFIALLFAIYHSFTWFSLAPKAMDIWLKGKPLEDKLIVSGHYIAFIIVSVFCLVVIL